MNECKHKKDEYGCIEGCKDYYPVIPRESIIAETKVGEEYRDMMMKRDCENTMEHIKNCEECQKKVLLFLADK